MSNEDVKEVKAATGIGCALALGFIVLCFGLTWLAQGNEFFLMKVFAPREEAVRRQTFEQSKAYKEGMAQDLRHMQLEYIQATPDQKQAIASVILHEYADIDQTRLPADLRQFLNEIKQSQGVQ